MSAPAKREYNIHEAKTHFSKILERVERGEEVVVNRAGNPIAKIVPLPIRVHRRSFGLLKGRIQPKEDWDSPETNETIARDFGLLP